MGKVIGRFDPTPSRTPEECERHYTEVHVRMAQDLLRPMPSLLSYHTDRAVAQADVNGGWRQRPRAWRFVVLRFTPGETLAFTAEQNEMVAQDHVNCLYRLRSCDVEESVLLDRVEGQLALAKFMIEADRAPGVDARGGWSAFSRARRAGPTAWCKAPSAHGADPQPRAQRGRLRAPRRRGPAAGRAARGQHPRRLHRGVLRPPALGPGSARPAGGGGRAARPRARRRQPAPPRGARRRST